jgi:queuosine precursor transporter
VGDLWMIASSYAVKVAFEVAATPFTFLAVDWLRRVERADAFDAGTNFNPFAWLGEGAAARAGSRE